MLNDEERPQDLLANLPVGKDNLNSKRKAQARFAPKTARQALIQFVLRSCGVFARREDVSASSSSSVCQLKLCVSGFVSFVKCC